MISRFYAQLAKSEPAPIDQLEWLFKEPLCCPLLCQLSEANVTNYSVLCFEGMALMWAVQRTGEIAARR